MIFLFPKWDMLVPWRVITIQWISHSNGDLIVSPPSKWQEHLQDMYPKRWVLHFNVYFLEGKGLCWFIRIYQPCHVAICSMWFISHHCWPCKPSLECLTVTAFTENNGHKVRFGHFWSCPKSYWISASYTIIYHAIHPPFQPGSKNAGAAHSSTHESKTYAGTVMEKHQVPWQGVKDSSWAYCLDGVRICCTFSL